MISIEYKGTIYYFDRRDLLDPRGLSDQLWKIIKSKKNLESAYFDSFTESNSNLI
jgi:hypothetical protein